MQQKLKCCTNAMYTGFFEDCIAEEQFEAQKLDIMRDAVRAKATYTMTTKQEEAIEPLETTSELPEPCSSKEPSPSLPMSPPAAADPTAAGQGVVNCDDTAAGQGVVNGDDTAAGQVVVNGDDTAAGQGVVNGGDTPAGEDVANGIANANSEASNGLPTSA